MARTKKDNANNTINIKSLNVKSHIGSAKYVNDDWGTVAFVIPRNELQMRFEDIELQYNCIYFLIGFENNKEMIYVGQAKKRNNGGSVLKRLREHDDSTTEKYRDVWDWVIVVTNKNDTWGLDDLNALENAFYHEIPAEQNLNGNNPNSGGADYEVYIDKIKQIKNYITSIGFTVFADAEDTEKIQITSEVNEYTIVEDLQNGMARIPEIITPQKVVKAMVDMLPEEVWNSHTIFLDPACKGGEYLKEIYDRLMETESVIAEYPNQFERSNHILLNQLYGIALSQVSLERTTKKLLGCGANIRVIPDYINKLKGINLGSRPDGSQNNILDILNKEFGKEMKFDVVIGNPPYQENTGGGRTGKTAKSIYTEFMDAGLKITEGICSLITPSKWFNMPDANDTRNKMIRNGHLVKIMDYINSKDIFGGVDIAGGVSYFLYDKNYIGDTEITSHNRGQIETYCSDLKKENIIFRSKHMKSILSHLIHDIEKSNFSCIVSGQTPFGLNTNYLEECSVIKTIDYNIRVVGARGNDGYTDIGSIRNGLEYLNKYKVITNHVTSEHAGETDKNGMVRVISKSQILEPNEVCTQTYMIIGYSDQIEIAKNIQSYIETKFARLLIWLTTTSISLSPQNFIFIPMQDFSHPWTDQMLYEKYNLTQEEIDYIEATIKPM